MIYQTEKPEGLVISPSMIQTYQNCQQLWYITYVLKIRAKQTPAQKLGSAVHKVLENYKRGVPLPTDRAGQIAATGIHLLPKDDVLGIEKNLFFREDSRSYWFRGIVDLLTESMMIDYKTTSNFKWNKKPGDLQSDPQAIIYARIWQILTGVDKIPDAQWIYFLTSKNPRTKIIKFDKIDPIQTLFGISDRIYEKWMNRATAEFPKNLEHCSKYGGCPNKKRCGINFFNQLERIEKMTSITERLEQMNKTEQMSVSETNESFEAFCLANPELSIIKAKSLYKKQPQRAVGMKKQVEINPPPKTEALEMRKKRAEQEARDLLSAIDNEKQEIIPILDIKQKMVDAVSEGLPKDQWKEEFKKLGGKRFTGALEQTLNAYCENQLTSVDTMPVASAVSDTGMTLYIDCFPVKASGKPVLLMDFLKPFIDQVEDEGSLEFWLATPYNEGEQTVARLLAKNMKWPETLYCNEYSTPKSILLVLIGEAHTVVKRT